MAGKTNKEQYDTANTRRTQALNDELASTSKAGEITGNVLSGLKERALGAMGKNSEQQSAIAKARQESEQGSRTQKLSTFQAALEARGMDPKGAETQNLMSQFGDNVNYGTALDEVRAKYESGNTENANMMYDALKGQAGMMTNQSAGNARSAYNRDSQSTFDAYTARRNELEGNVAKTKAEQGASELNTYLTLKKESDQRKAEEAQAKLENAVAMGKLSSDNYFKEAGLGIDRERLSQGAERLSQGATKLNQSEQNMLHKWKMDTDKLTLEKRKQYVKEKIAGLTPEEKKRVYKYYNPKTGKITSSTSGQIYH
jgi:hypothetical protein